MWLSNLEKFVGAAWRQATLTIVRVVPGKGAAPAVEPLYIVVRSTRGGLSQSILATRRPEPPR